MLMRKQFAIVVKEMRPNGGQILISTGAVDRDRDRVLPHGGRIDNYMKNPVVQWGHNYYDPWATIGRTNKIEISDEGIVADFDLRPAANEQDPQNVILLLWNGGWVNAASIGFDPTGGPPRSRGWEENDLGGRDFTEWELLEWSLVPIPANQEALRLAAKALTGDAPEGSQAIALPCIGCGEEYQASVELSTSILTGQALQFCEKCIAVVNAMRAQDPALVRKALEWNTADFDGENAPDPAQEPSYSAKRGRVLNAANEDRLRRARDLLNEVIAQVEEEPGEEDDGKALGKSAIPYSVHDSPAAADEGMSWDGNAARARLREWAGGDEWDPAKYRQGFVFVDGEPDQLGSYLGPHHDVVDGDLVTVWGGVRAAMGSLVFGSRGGRIEDEGDRRGVYNHLAGHYEQFGKEVPEFREYDEAELRALFEQDEGQNEPEELDALAREVRALRNVIGMDALVRGLRRVKEVFSDE